MNDPSRLWNEMPKNERERLHPFLLSTHILHLQQVRALIVKAHKRELAEVDAWIANLQSTLGQESP